MKMEKVPCNVGWEWRYLGEVKWNTKEMLFCGALVLGFFWMKYWKSPGILLLFLERFINNRVIFAVHHFN